MESVTTPRLTVRRFAATDLADYLAYQSLPEVRQFMSGSPMDEAGAIQFLERQSTLDEAEKGTYHAYAVQHVGDNRVIGDVGVYLHVEPADEGDVGFQFHPAYHGQGYASEAVHALLRHLFEDLNLRRVTSGCDSQNTASYRLMERLGMHRQTDFNGSRVYALTR